jgi:hypothetical protein
MASFTGNSTPEKKESIVIAEIQDMLKDLVEISDEDWGKYAFSREPLNGKFDDETKKRLILEANKCGVDYAHKMSSQYGQNTPQELAAKLGLNIEYLSKPVGGGHVIFAQFVEPNHITIFRDCVEKANELIENKDLLSVLSALDVEKVLLAHEIFHYIEELYKHEIFTKTEKVKLWAPKPFKNESRIVCLGEIAGMAFAKELLKMPYSPYVLDVFLVYDYNPEAAYYLYKEIMEITGN